MQKKNAFISYLLPTMATRATRAKPRLQSHQLCRTNRRELSPPSVRTRSGWGCGDHKKLRRHVIVGHVHILFERRRASSRGGGRLRKIRIVQEHAKHHFAYLSGRVVLGEGGDHGGRTKSQLQNNQENEVSIGKTFVKKTMIDARGWR